jgi:hypothetical protein
MPSRRGRSWRCPWSRGRDDAGVIAGRCCRRRDRRPCPEPSNRRSALLGLARRADPERLSIAHRMALSARLVADCQGEREHRRAMECPAGVRGPSTSPGCPQGVPAVTPATAPAPPAEADPGPDRGRARELEPPRGTRLFRRLHGAEGLIGDFWDAEDFRLSEQDRLDVLGDEAINRSGSAC